MKNLNRKHLILGLSLLALVAILIYTFMPAPLMDLGEYVEVGEVSVPAFLVDQFKMEEAFTEACASALNIDSKTVPYHGAEAITRASAEEAVLQRCRTAALILKFYDARRQDLKPLSFLQLKKAWAAGELSYENLPEECQTILKELKHQYGFDQAAKQALQKAFLQRSAVVLQYAVPKMAETNSSSLDDLRLFPIRYC